jgi:hypothetical protein
LPHAIEELQMTVTTRALPLKVSPFFVTVAPSIAEGLSYVKKKLRNISIHFW